MSANAGTSSPSPWIWRVFRIPEETPEISTGWWSWQGRWAMVITSLKPLKSSTVCFAATRSKRAKNQYLAEGLSSLGGMETTSRSREAQSMRSRVSKCWSKQIPKEARVWRISLSLANKAENLLFKEESTVVGGLQRKQVDIRVASRRLFPVSSWCPGAGKADKRIILVCEFVNEGKEGAGVIVLFASSKTWVVFARDGSLQCSVLLRRAKPTQDLMDVLK